MKLRLRSDRPPLATILACTALSAFLAGACAARLIPAPTVGPTTTPIVVSSPSATASASLAPAPDGSSVPGPGSVAPSVTEEEAVHLVLATDPLFAGVRRQRSGAIGESSWYQVVPVASGFQVTVHLGWGDCQSGCIYGRTWLYSVDGTGTVRLVDESGDALPGT